MGEGRVSRDERHELEETGRRGSNFGAGVYAYIAGRGRAAATGSTRSHPAPMPPCPPPLEARGMTTLHVSVFAFPLHSNRTPHTSPSIPVSFPGLQTSEGTIELLSPPTPLVRGSYRGARYVSPTPRPSDCRWLMDCSREGRMPRCARCRAMP